MAVYKIYMKDKKFRELAKSRTNKAIKAIKLIGNLANKSHYSYTNEESDQILNAIEKEVRVIKQKFRHSKSGRNRDEFEFK
jgi:hypothetical protein